MQTRTLLRCAMLFLVVLAQAQIGLLPARASAADVPSGIPTNIAATTNIRNTTSAISALNTSSPAICVVYAVDDQANSSSQLFTINLRTKTTAALGSLLAGYNIKGLAIHPRTNLLYAVSSKDAALPGQLYIVDAQTGALAAIGNTGFNDIRNLTFRASDATLWGWSATGGLIQIDTTTGHGIQVFAATKNIAGLAWSNDGKLLYATAKNVLWVYDPSAATLSQVATNLPDENEGLQMRADGLLMGSVEQDGAITMFAYDPITLRRVVDERIFTEFDDIEAFAWPAACGSPSAGGPTQMIQTATLDKSQICSGDTVLVTVVAQHPVSPQGQIDITINGQLGSPQSLQFTGVPGARLIDVTASTPEKYSDQRQLTVEVLPCATNTPLPIVHARPNLYHDLTIDFEITNASALQRHSPIYIWDFGDGQTTQTSVPAISHYFGDSVDRDTVNNLFQVGVSVHQDGQPDLVTHKTVTIQNTYALNKQRGFIQPRITANPHVQISNGILAGDYTIANLEDTPLQLTSRQMQFQSCDPDQPDTAPVVEAMALPVDGKQVVLQQFAIPVLSLPPDTCGVHVLLSGQTSAATRVYGSVDIQFKVNPRTIQEISDPAASARLNQIMSQGLLGDATTVSDEDLYRLAQAGQIPRTVPNQLALSGTITRASTQTTDLLNQPCVPGDTPPDPSLTCQPSADWYYRPAYIANAQKGDVILSPGCHGTIGELLRNVDPPQLYSHSGIMTRDRYEVRHATASEERYQSYPVGTDPFGDPAPSDGFRPDVLRYGWPGTITQPIYQAFEGEYYIDPENQRAYRIDGFSHDPTGCDGEAAKVFPLVVKPAPERENEIRPLLRAAADQALALNGHYRFYGYSNGAIATDPAYAGAPESGWAAGTAAVVCSTFIWDTMKLANIALEGATLEPNDYASGAEQDAATQDGLYLYSAAERQNAAHTLYTRTYNRVLDAADQNTCLGLPCGVIWNFFAGAAEDISNQLVNCFDTDWCDTPAKDSNRWQQTGVGRSVSPDNILFWDIWNAPQQGVYGYNERMDYRPGMYARDRWQRSVGKGSVIGHVFLNGVPAADALVRVAGFEQTTDASGAYSFVAVPAGSYQIMASKQIGPGQTASDQRDVAVAEGNTTTIDLHLGVAPPPPPRTIVHVVVDRLHGFGCWGTYIDPPIGPAFCSLAEDPDFYADVTIDGRFASTRDTYIHDQNDVSPNWDFAQQVDPARANIPLSVHIGDVDGFLRGDDDSVDIKPGSGRDLNLLLDLTTCTVSGDVAGSCQAQIHSAGDDADGHEDLADIWFHVYVEIQPVSI